MPRAGEPRVTVRFSAAEHAALDAAARSAGVALGALVREAAVRHGAGVAREAAEGGVSLRRASAGKVETALEARAAMAAAREGQPLAFPDGRRDPAVERAIAFRRATGALP